MNYIKYYQNYNVLYKILPYIFNKEFVLGYPKHHEKGQSLKARHRCHNFQGLQFLLFKKYHIQLNEYNMFSSVATYQQGIPYSDSSGGLIDADDWFKNHWKRMIKYDLFIDVDIDTHQDIDFAWLSVKLIKDFFDKLNCPYNIRFSGRGFHIIVPFEVMPFEATPDLFDRMNENSIFRIYAKIRSYLKEHFTELIDDKATGSTAKIKVPYSVALYRDNVQYVCTPMNSEHEFNTFLLEKYTPEIISSQIRERNEKLFNSEGFTDAMLNKVGVIWPSH